MSSTIPVLCRGSTNVRKMTSPSTQNTWRYMPGISCSGNAHTSYSHRHLPAQHLGGHNTTEYPQFYAVLPGEFYKGTQYHPPHTSLTVSSGATNDHGAKL